MRKSYRYANHFVDVRCTQANYTLQMTLTSYNYCIDFDGSTINGTFHKKLNSSVSIRPDTAFNTMAARAFCEKTPIAVTTTIEYHELPDHLAVLKAIERIVCQPKATRQPAWIACDWYRGPGMTSIKRTSPHENQATTPPIGPFDMGLNMQKWLHSQNIYTFSSQCISYHPLHVSWRMWFHAYFYQTCGSRVLLTSSPVHNKATFRILPQHANVSLGEAATG